MLTHCDKGGRQEEGILKEVRLGCQKDTSPSSKVLLYVLGGPQPWIMLGQGTGPYAHVGHMSPQPDRVGRPEAAHSGIRQVFVPAPPPPHTHTPSLKLCMFPVSQSLFVGLPPIDTPPPPRPLHPSYTLTQASLSANCRGHTKYLILVNCWP